MEYRNTYALTIGCSDYGETSQVVTFYTRDYGKLQILARGAKRPHNNFEGPFDLLTYRQITFVYKPFKQLFTLISSKIYDNFLAVRNNYKKMWKASFVVEFLNEMNPAEDRHSNLFDLAIFTLREIAHSDGRVDIDINYPNLVLLSFATRALKYLGYMPNLETCVNCEARIYDLKECLKERGIFFNFAKGGILCASCHATTINLGKQAQNFTRKITLGVLSLFKNLSRGKIKLDRLKINLAMQEELSLLLMDYIYYILGKKLKTSLCEIGY